MSSREQWSLLGETAVSGPWGQLGIQQQAQMTTQHVLEAWVSRRAGQQGSGALQWAVGKEMVRRGKDEPSPQA